MTKNKPIKQENNATIFVESRLEGKFKLAYKRYYRLPKYQQSLVVRVLFRYFEANDKTGLEPAEIDVLQIINEIKSGNFIDVNNDKQQLKRIG